jgi:hypothetical protein
MTRHLPIKSLSGGVWLAIDHDLRDHHSTRWTMVSQIMVYPTTNNQTRLVPIHLHYDTTSSHSFSAPAVPSTPAVLWTPPPVLLWRPGHSFRPGSSLVPAGSSPVPDSLFSALPVALWTCSGVPVRPRARFHALGSDFLSLGVLGALWYMVCMEDGF